MARANPFVDFGSTITGKRFVGRETELRTIENRVFGEGGFGSIEIVGLPRIGKTSLVSEAVRRAESRSNELRHIVVQANVGSFDSFDNLLRGVAIGITAEVRERDLGTPPIESVTDTAVEAPNVDNLRAVFRLLRRSGIRAVCILDEFDAARRVFKDTPSCFQWIRELCSNSQFKAAVIFVTRRHLQDVARLAGYENDYWANVLITLPLKPLSDAEAASFFHTMAAAGIPFNHADRSRVNAICGGHPFLLAGFGYHAWEYAEAGSTIDTEWIGKTRNRFVLEYVGQMSTILRDGPLFDSLAEVLKGSRRAVPQRDIEALCELGVILPDGRGSFNGFSPTIEEYVRTKRATIDEERVRDLMATGESDTVEFKSSLRWDLRDERVNKDLEGVIVKTLAGFLNGKGGTLLIGVDDDGTAVGLASDYGTLKKKDRDGFELHLGQLMVNNFPATVSAQCLTVGFHEIDGEDICEITVVPSKTEIYVDQKNERIFYLRIGNATCQLPVDEVVEYSRNRFQSHSGKTS